MSSDLEAYSIIIDSSDRLSGTPDNFVVNFNPTISRVRRIELMNAFLPFNFNNVTSTYGNTFYFSLSGTAFPIPPLVNIAVPIPNGFYTLPQIITAINESLVNVFAGILTGYASPITFSLASIPNRLILNYNASIFGGIVTLSFNQPPKNQSTGIIPNYLYKMLGLMSTGITTFTYGPGGGPMYVNTLPNPATAQLPISYVLLFIQGLPAKCITSSQIGTQFYIDIEGATILGQQIALPNSYKNRRDYWNVIELQNDFFNFQQLNVQITDNFGQSLLFDQNVTDWHFSFKVTTFK